MTCLFASLRCPAKVFKGHLKKPHHPLRTAQHPAWGPGVGGRSAAPCAGTPGAGPSGLGVGPLTVHCSCWLCHFSLLLFFKAARRSSCAKFVGGCPLGRWFTSKPQADHRPGVPILRHTLLHGCSPLTSCRPVGQHTGFTKRLQVKDVTQEPGIGWLKGQTKEHQQSKCREGELSLMFSMYKNLQFLAE